MTSRSRERPDRVGAHRASAAPPEALDLDAYARALRDWANGRLDETTLRHWMTQRLIVDCALDHSHAELAVDRVLQETHSYRPRHHRHVLHAPHRGREMTHV
jgi:hypothetical protein